MWIIFEVWRYIVYDSPFCVAMSRVWGAVFCVFQNGCIFLCFCGIVLSFKGVVGSVSMLFEVSG